MLRTTPLAIVDVETTGPRPGEDRVTEIAVLEVDGFRLTSRWSTLVNPGTSIPAEIQALTGITRHAHHARLVAALAPLRNVDWPHRGPLGVVETDRSRDATEIHVVDRWCYLGAARDDGELAELLQEKRQPDFDYDHYRILARHLGKRGVRVVQLGA